MGKEKNPETPQIGKPEESKSKRPEKLKDDEAVIQISGNNMFGQEVYSYILFKLTEFKQMREDMLSNKNIKPQDYGTVIESGKGRPSEELKEKMRVLYGIVDTQPPPIKTPEKKEIDLDGLTPMEGLDLDLSKRIKQLGQNILPKDS